MPQHLRIEVRGKLVGWLTTSHTNGPTIYNVRLRVPEIGACFLLSDVDTGVQRQPPPGPERDRDTKDDFTHARRCIAGACASADRFIDLLQKRDTPEYAEMKPITMRLMTNCFDRGSVEVHPVDDRFVDMVVTIGNGANRVRDALPKDKCELSYEGIDASGTFTQTERALKILRSIGSDLLKSLAERSP